MFNWTVQNALELLRRQVEDVDQVYTIYVTDNNSNLLGTLSLKKFLYAS